MSHIHVLACSRSLRISDTQVLSGRLLRPRDPLRTPHHNRRALWSPHRALYAPSWTVSLALARCDFADRPRNCRLPYVEKAGAGSRSASSAGEWYSRIRNFVIDQLTGKGMICPSGFLIPRRIGRGWPFLALLPRPTIRYARLEGADAIRCGNIDDSSIDPALKLRFQLACHHWREYSGSQTHSRVREQSESTWFRALKNAALSCWLDVRESAHPIR